MNRRGGVLHIQITSVVWFFYFLLITGFPSLNFLAPTVERLWRYCTLLCVAWLIIIAAKTGKFRISIVTVVGIAFLFIPVFSTVINHCGMNNIRTTVRQFYMCAMMLIGWDCMFRQIGVKRSVGVLLVLFEFLVYVNMIAMILYPGGMARITAINGTEGWVPLPRGISRNPDMKVAWMLDHQGLLTLYAAPGTCLSLLWAYLSRKKPWNFRTAVYVIVCCIEVFYFSHAANCILTYSVFLAILIFIPLWQKFGLALPSIRWLLFGIFVLFFSVIYFNIQEWFEWLIINVLQRDLSLTGRLTVWENTIQAIISKPFWGWGQIDSFEAWRLFVVAAHPHNQFLYIAFQGGLVAFGLFVFFLFYAFRPLLRYRKINKPCVRVIWAATLCILIGMFGDRYIPYYGITFVVFLLASRTSEILELS